MIDRQQAYNNQISDFLNEFKFRFSILNHSGMPSKLGYTTKLNRKENSSLNIYVPDNFPFSAPLIYVTPKIDIPGYVDDLGRVRDSSLQYWNVNSTLCNSIRNILIRLEVGSESNNQQIQFQNVGNFNPQPNLSNSSLGKQNKNSQDTDTKDININVNNLFGKNSEQSSIFNKKGDSQILINELNTKSIDELVYIFLNQEDFINEFMSKYKEGLKVLKNEVSQLHDQCLEKRRRYDNEMISINGTINEFNQYKDELKVVYFEKIKIDNKYTVDNLLDKINEDLSKTNIERQKLISDFISKKISFFDMVELFKEPSVKIHQLNLTKEKLYQYKNKD